MPNEKANNKKEKLLCVDNLRHAEYYEIFYIFCDKCCQQQLKCLTELL